MQCAAQSGWAARWLPGQAAATVVCCSRHLGWAAEWLGHLGAAASSLPSGELCSGSLCLLAAPDVLEQAINAACGCRAGALRSGCVSWLQRASCICVPAYAGSSMLWCIHLQVRAHDPAAIAVHTAAVSMHCWQPAAALQHPALQHAAASVRHEW